MQQPGSDVFGIILARGGSKRIPHKNIVQVNGKPLLAYTCEAARGSKLLTRVILSTDSAEIAAVGKEYGVEVPFMRPRELASDEANSMDAIRHVLRELEKKEGYAPPLFVLLQPTSPLRTAEHIDEGIRLMLKTDADSVVSVTEVPSLFNPSFAMQIKEGKLTKPKKKALQEMEKYYAYNGAVYVLRTERLRQSDDPFGDDCRPLVMSKEDSLDIDTKEDLALAECLLQRKGGSSQILSIS
ncbi:MAG: acylneuraminate cytidylyltransferase family protein [Candidatus Peribacteraceae bacterium]|jgi:CMP-N-acetylneuraminic acid synthetase